MGRIRKASRVNRRADPLSQLYMPQVEQFGIMMQQHGDALCGSVSNDRADATVHVRRLGNAAVVTSHRILVKRDMPFHEHGVTGLCVCTLSSDSLALCPIAQPTRSHAEGNVAVFGQGDYETATSLAAGTHQDAVSITFLPKWFSLWEIPRRNRALKLIDEMGETWSSEISSQVDRIARSISPLYGSASLHAGNIRSRIELVAEMAVAWHEERERAEAAAGTLEQARLVRMTQRRILCHLDEALTIDCLARDLLTSRSRLCAAFKQETGMGVGAFVRRERMRRAALLLEARCSTIEEVAAAVGYPRTSSFTVAFERELGCPPSAWRARNGD